MTAFRKKIIGVSILVLLVGVVASQVGKYEQFPPYLIWFAILLWMRGRHPTLLDETDAWVAKQNLRVVA